MPDTVALVEEEQRCSLDGFGEQILQLVSLENGLTAKVGPATQTCCRAHCDFS